jgi:predicted O-linked N-acetylglucosamine transferase (SPINDLY family)
MNETAMKNLKMQASNEGVNDNRIIFAPRMPNVNDHLNRIRLADLFLDTFPYNAHTTANDALRVGLPLLTLIGETFASRVAASLLNSVGLSDLITTNQEGYEALAIELAINPDRLRNLKSKLLSNLPGSSLSNTKLFTQNIEKAYQEMYRRYQEDLPPETITI